MTDENIELIKAISKLPITYLLIGIIAMLVYHMMTIDTDRYSHKTIEQCKYLIEKEVRNINK